MIGVLKGEREREREGRGGITPTEDLEIVLQLEMCHIDTQLVVELFCLNIRGAH